jgi:hypothetical protein
MYISNCRDNADLINTSMEQQGKSELSEEELQLLSRGGRMWEEDSKSKSNRKGLFGDVFNAFKAVAGMLFNDLYLEYYHRLIVNVTKCNLLMYFLCEQVGLT